MKHDLRAGPISCVLEDGALRWVTLTLPDGSEREVVRGVYAAVRDHNWGTPAPHFTRYDVETREDSFSVQITAEHVTGEIDLQWHGSIEGGADGTIAFTFDGTARSTFQRNRLGFCVLHPMETAGSPVTVEHPDGTREHGTFPVLISPHQPFVAIAALRQSLADGVDLEVQFEGEVFEMEDQRNWTDASYKTYCTPLALPFPVELAKGTKVSQRVTIRVLGDAPASRAARVSASNTTSSVRVGPRHLGSLPPMGLQVASHGQPLDHREIDLLSQLRPSHLWLTLQLTNPNWERTLGEASELAQTLHAALEIEAICGDTGAGIDALAAALSTRRVPLSAVHVYPKTGVVTTEIVIQRARDVFRAARVNAPIGGGSRADFVNVNRVTLPVDLMDFVAFAVNPQVHAFDNASLVETLAAQTVVLENAERIARGLPVRVGPVTLRQRINPAATASEPALAPGELPRAADPRQPTLFAAGWTLGTIHRLVHAAAITLFETTGRLGVIEQTERFIPHPSFPSVAGARFPVFDVLAAIAARARDHVFPVDTTPVTSIEALALGGSQGMRLFVANLQDRAQRVVVDSLSLTGASVRLLAATTSMDPLNRGDGPPPAPAGTLDLESRELRLPAHAIAIVDIGANT
ncbi:MAG: hypothetical protein ACR2NO_05175 [Chloroflexota bacterium]